MAEQVVLVDEKNQEIGVMEKLEAHLNGGHLHRAFSVFIFNKKNELLLQRRDIKKYHSGGLWTNTVCSHPRPNETYEDAVHRRMHEEMGFDCEVKKIGCFVYKASFDNGLTEFEYDCIFVGKWNGIPHPNPQEIMDYKWISIEELKKDIQSNPQKYTAWLPLALEKNLV